MTLMSLVQNLDVHRLVCIRFYCKHPGWPIHNCETKQTF